MMPISHPRSLATQISTQQAGTELLIYDERRHQAFCLNATSAAIWKLCDGRRTLAQITAAAKAEGLAGVTEEVVLLAVHQLHADGLVVDETPWIPIPDVSRRVMLQRLTTGAVILLPGVAMVMAPKAAEAYNGCADCDVNGGGSVQQLQHFQWQQSQQSRVRPTDPSSDYVTPELFKP